MTPRERVIRSICIPAILDHAAEGHAEPKPDYVHAAFAIHFDGVLDSRGLNFGLNVGRLGWWECCAVLDINTTDLTDELVALVAIDALGPGGWTLPDEPGSIDTLDALLALNLSPEGREQVLDTIEAVLDRFDELDKAREPELAKAAKKAASAMRAFNFAAVAAGAMSKLPSRFQGLAGAA